MSEVIDEVPPADILRVINELCSGKAGAPRTQHLVPASSQATFVYRPGKVLRPLEVDHLAYVTAILSSVSTSDVLDQIANHFLGCSVEEHARSLDELRDGHRHVHGLLIRGDGHLALDAIRRSNSIVPDTREMLLRVVSRHMRCWLIRTARDRADRLADFAREPRETAFAGFTEWKTVGHLLLTTQAAPARLLQRLIGAVRTGSFDRLTREQTSGRMVELGLFPVDRDPLMMKLKNIAYQLGRPGSSGLPPSFEKLHARMAEASLALSRLTQRDMQEAGFSRLDMNGYRYGLNTSEVISWVVLELHEASRHLDACIDARLAGGKLPERIVGEQSIKHLAFSATILRADAAGDRHAVDLDHPKPHRNSLDRDRNSGAAPVRKMRLKLADTMLVAHLRAELGIDVTAWFRQRTERHTPRILRHGRIC